MKKLCTFISILVLISDVIARVDDGMIIIDEDEADLKCCPNSMYLVYDRNLPCFDPVNNSRTPNRIGCYTSGGSYNFTVKAGIIEYTEYGPENIKKTIDSDDACYGDLYWSKNITKSLSMQVLIICERELIAKYTIHKYTVITSVIFLSITAAIYAIFGELRDIFGMSVTSFCGSLAISLGLLTMDGQEMASCIIKGYSVYFFLMAAFFWSNSISIQILRDTRGIPTVDRGWKEFRWYCLYSWGFPTIFTTIVIIVEHHPGDHDKPGFLLICWFSNKAQEWYYLNSVLTILLMINFAIFIYIAIMLWRFAKKKTYLKTLRYRISMTVRLILVMGLPWILKMFGLAVGDGTILSWFVFEMIAGLQGILIFLVLVMRKKVVGVLHQRGLLHCLAGSVEKWLAARDHESCEIQPAEDLQLDEPSHE